MDTKRCCLLLHITITIIRKIVTNISLHLRVLLAKSPKCTPYQPIDCNISLDRYLPDAHRSTKQKLRLSILSKDTNMLALDHTRSRAITAIYFHYSIQERMYRPEQNMARKCDVWQKKVMTHELFSQKKKIVSNYFC